jgi:predicted amidohydrolase YtcJ
MKKRNVWMVVMAIAASISLGYGQQTADTILHNGKVLTVDANFSIAEAVAVGGDRILAVGTNDEVLRLAGPDTLKIDLKGRTVTPGLINTHVHQESPGGYGRDLTAPQHKRYPLNFRAVRTKDDVLKQIKDVIAAFPFEPGEWIQFSTNPRGEQARMLYDDLNRWELDKAAPDNPIALSMGIPILNMALVNSKAIEALWAKHGDFVETYGRYWIDDSGRPDGHLEPPAVRTLVQEFLAEPEVELMAPLYRKTLEERAALGVTTLSGGLHAFSVDVYKWLDSRGEMPLRYGYGVSWTFGMPGMDMKHYEMGGGTDTVWITSMSPRAIDGSGSRMCVSLERDSQAVTAAAGEVSGMMGLSAISEWWPRGQCHLDIEYSGGTRGASLKRNYFPEWFSEVATDGLRSANNHTSGDESHSRYLSMLERIDRENPGVVKGWAMDHCDLINPQDIPRAAKLGLMWSCDIRFGVSKDYSSPKAAAFGEEVVHTYAVPIKSMLEAGINVSQEGQWDGMELLITRKDENGKVWGPDQRVDRLTALRISTQNGANYVLKGDKLGSIEPGKLADLVVIDRDFLTMPEDDISEIRSLLTLLGGKFIFLRSDFAAEHNLRPAGAVISTYEELLKRRPSRF